MTRAETRKATTGAAVRTTGLSGFWTQATVEAETGTATTETKILPRIISVTLVTRQMWIKKKEEIRKIKLLIADQIVTMEMEVGETEKELIKEVEVLEKTKTPRIERLAAETRKTGAISRTRIETSTGGDQTMLIGDRGQNQGGTVEPAEIETEETEKVQEQTDESLQLNDEQTFSV